MGGTLEARDAYALPCRSWLTIASNVVLETRGRKVGDEAALDIEGLPKTVRLRDRDRRSFALE